MPAPAKFIDYIDQNADRFIEHLRQAVRIKRYVSLSQRLVSRLIHGIALPSISSDARRRQDVIDMGHHLNDQLVSLGVTTKLVDLGTHEMQGQTLPLPPAILGRLGEDKKKRTVLIYGHYDVQPVRVSVCEAVLIIYMAIRHSSRMDGTPIHLNS